MAGTAVAAVVILALASLAVYAHHRAGQLRRVPVQSLTAGSLSEPFTILVVGSDSRAAAPGGGGFGSAQEVPGQRSDVLKVLRVDPRHRSLSLLSIPRDLILPLAGTGRRDRINEAFRDGPARIVQTVEDSLGIPINHYVLVDFAGFEGAVDALGGIRLDFPYPARDANTGLDVTFAGCQHLDGMQALAVSRSRHYAYLRNGSWLSDGSGDLGRIARQDVFLRALLQSAGSTDLANPLTANSVTSNVVRHLTVDDQLSSTDTVKLARDFRSFNPGGLVSTTLPTLEARSYQDLGDVLLPDQPADQRVIATFLGRPPPPPESATPTAAGTQSPAAGSGRGATAPVAPLPPPPTEFDPHPCAGP